MKKMRKFFAISLILTAIVTAAVSIPPQETEQNAKTEYVSDVKDKFPEEDTNKIKENNGFHRFNPRELVCDAFGKCKHRIASALEGTKDSVSEKMNEIKEVTHKLAHEASEKVSESVGNKVDEVKEGAKETAEKVKGKAKDISDTTKTLKGDVKRNASEDFDIIENAVKEDAHRIKVIGKRGYQEIRWLFSDVSAYIFSTKNFRYLMGMIHLLGFAFSYGVCLWVTFISSNILSRALTKQQYAMVQSKIYPVYFKTMSYGVATACMGHHLSQRHQYHANQTGRIQDLVFLAIFFMTMFNSFYLEPRAAKVTRERTEVEKVEGKGKDVYNIEPSTTNVDTLMDPTGRNIGEKTTHEPLETQQELSEGAKKERPQVVRSSQRLKKLNIISSILNALRLMGLTYHLIYLNKLVYSKCY